MPNLFKLYNIIFLDYSSMLYSFNFSYNCIVARLSEMKPCKLYFMCNELILFIVVYSSTK